MAENPGNLIRRGEEEIELGERIEVLPHGTVLIEYGPMRMSIQVSEYGKLMATLAEEGANKARQVLIDLARFLPAIQRKSGELKAGEGYPDVVRRMIEATQMMEEPDLTPLAAVAGAASDVVADFLILRGGTKVIVDNGGDIAIRLKGGEAARVGIKTEVYAEHPSYLISIDEAAGIGGVATSGLGGRSFTKGIASAVTVISESASLSDAAATVIGNSTNVEDYHIRRALAESIYPDTDIAGEWITVGVGELSRERIEEALSQGLSKADSLCRKRLIRGALIAVKDRVSWTDSLNPWLSKLCR